MTVFTVEALLRTANGGSLDLKTAINDLRHAYRDWYYTQRPRPEYQPVGVLATDYRMQKCQAPGRTCLCAISEGCNGTVRHHINDSKGCGGVMRVAPIGLISSLSPRDAFRLGASAAALTHGHPTGFYCSGVMAAIVRLLIDGTGLKEAAQQAIDIMDGLPQSDETYNAVTKALKLAADDTPASPKQIARLGQGWVGEEALSIALYACLKAETYEDAVILATNHSGDSDSTASVAGQLYGAWQGNTAVPVLWAKDLDILDILLDFGEKMTAAFGEAAA
jgi:ADP-ribosylglycohydrolase